MPSFQSLEEYWLSNRQSFLVFVVIVLDYQDRNGQEQGQFGLGLTQD